jgi:hypothetical protein
MSSVSKRKQQILLRSELRHLEEYIKGLEAFRDGHLMFDRMMREAVRADRANFESPTQYLLYICHLLRSIPQPADAPDLPSLLADLHLVEEGELQSMYAKGSAEQLSTYKRLLQIHAMAQDRELAALSAEVRGFPDPWLVDPKLRTHLAEKLEAIEARLRANEDQAESKAEGIIEEMRGVVESMEDPRARMQPIDNILERVYQRRAELIELLSVGGAERQLALQNLKPCEREAYDAYERGLARLRAGEGKVPTDKEVFEWLKEYSSPKYSRMNFSTWARHLRVARKALGEQRNRSPKGRVGRSVMHQSTSDAKPPRGRLTAKEQQEAAANRLRDLASGLYTCPAKGGKRDALWAKVEKVLERLGYAARDVERVVQAGPERLAELAEAIAKGVGD